MGEPDHGREVVSSVKVGRRQAREARAELGAGGLSHQERRRLRSITRGRDDAARRRRLERRHTVIVIVGALAAMAVVGVSFGLVPAARHPGGSSQVFALHGSHTWLMDLLIVVGAGLAAAAALWISPLGTRGRAPSVG
jgi:hypothetical protein